LDDFVVAGPEQGEGEGGGGEIVLEGEILFPVVL
jgi:hypothetical protein